MSATEGGQKDKSKSPPIVKNKLQTDMEQTVPFTDLLIPVNPPVRVSTVYAGQMPLFSEKDHQM